MFLFFPSRPMQKRSLFGREGKTFPFPRLRRPHEAQPGFTLFLFARVGFCELFLLNPFSYTGRLAPFFSPFFVRRRVSPAHVGRVPFMEADRESSSSPFFLLSERPWRFLPWGEKGLFFFAHARGRPGEVARPFFFLLLPVAGEGDPVRTIKGRGLIFLSHPLCPLKGSRFFSSELDGVLLFRLGVVPCGLLFP